MQYMNHSCQQDDCFDPKTPFSAGSNKGKLDPEQSKLPRSESATKIKYGAKEELNVTSKDLEVTDVDVEHYYNDNELDKKPECQPPINTPIT